MFQRILVPLDSSNRSEKAIPLAAHIARAGNGTIVFVYVVLRGELSITSSIAVNTEVAGAIIAQAEQPYSAGDPGGADVIAMATHGRGGLQRLVIGSVTEHILGAIKLPLLVVRPRQAKDGDDERAGEAAQS